MRSTSTFRSSAARREPGLCIARTASIWSGLELDRTPPGTRAVRVVAVAPVCDKIVLALLDTYDHRAV
jgi:hypothetical protein